MLVSEAAGLATEPDMLLCTWDSLAAGRVRYREFVEGSGRWVEVTGSPDLVVEVVSKSSVRKDTKVLPKLYFAAGVSDYWLVDARRQEIDFHVFCRGEDGFATLQPDSEGYRCTEVLRAEVKLVRELNRRGTFQYRLIMRPLAS